MAQIKMPVTPRSAYDPKRAPNTLLLTHVRELETAVSEAGRRVRRKKPKTEEQVAAYIRHLNRALYHQMLLPRAIRRRPLDVPLEGESPSTRRKTRRGSAKRAARKTTSTTQRKKQRKKMSSSPKRTRSQRS